MYPNTPKKCPESHQTLKFSTYLSHILGISQAYFIPNLRHISGIPQALVSHISGISKAFNHTFCRKIPWPPIRDIPGMSRGISDILRYI